MSDHTCDFWPTPSGALECACGKSYRPFPDETPKEESSK